MNPRATFKALLDARAPLYREVATVEVDTSRRSANQVARAVLVAAAQVHPEAVPPAVLQAALDRRPRTPAARPHPRRSTRSTCPPPSRPCRCRTRSCARTADGRRRGRTGRRRPSVS